MAPTLKTHTTPTDIIQVSEEASGPSDYSSEASSSESGFDNSDSDTLDSHASRKRRKTAPIEDDTPVAVVASAPSRFKAKIQNAAVQKNVAETQSSSGTISVPIDQQTSFASLNVKPWLVGSLEAMAIKRPTGIQKGCIPEILKGRDCIGGSRTGSGKTVAFAVPILQTWAEDPFGIFAVILTPTR